MSVGKPGNGSCLDIDRFDALGAIDVDAVLDTLAIDTHKFHLFEHHAQVDGAEARNIDAAFIGHEGASDDKGAGLDAVADHAMGNGMQLLHALDGHDGRARADDLGAHLVKHVGKVDDLGLAGSVVDNRGALRAHSSHDEILGSAHARELERDGGAAQALGSTGVDVTVGGVELDAQSLETQDMHINLAGTQVAAARQRQSWRDGNDRAGGPSQPWRRASWRRARREAPKNQPGRYRFPERVLIENFDRGAHALEHLAHNVDIGNIGHVLKRCLARRQKRCSHEFECGILCTRDGHGASDGAATLNADNIQGLPFQKACPGWLGHPGHDVFANGRTLKRLTIGQA